MNLGQQGLRRALPRMLDLRLLQSRQRALLYDQIRLDIHVSCRTALMTQPERDLTSDARLTCRSFTSGRVALRAGDHFHFLKIYLNTLTALTSSSICVRRLSDAAVLCSTSAAFC